MTSTLDFKGSIRRCWELMLKICRGGETGRERKRGRQHMLWPRYNLRLVEKVICLHVTMYLSPSPNNETECTDSSYLAVSVLSRG